MARTLARAVVAVGCLGWTGYPAVCGSKKGRHQTSHFRFCHWTAAAGIARSFCDTLTSCGQNRRCSELKSRDRWANVGPFVVTIDPRWRKWRFTSLPAAGIEVFVGLIIELYVESWADINHVEPGKIFLNICTYVVNILLST